MLKYLIPLMLLPGAALAADFTVTLSDPVQLAGVTYARAEYNASCATATHRMKAPCVPIQTDAAYVSYWLQREALAWGRKSMVAPLNKASTDCVGKGECENLPK